ncbi:MAG: iron-containing alcohol dehydrogenase [Magnetococcales bacterium]|nr:iron-containing alcohol dehydrogenase [Magnetococcales bacterium]
MFLDQLMVFLHLANNGMGHPFHTRSHSNEESRVKSFVQAAASMASPALVDPELTTTEPKEQTACGVCDLITHVTETCFYRGTALCFKTAWSRRWLSP